MGVHVFSRFTASFAWECPCGVKVASGEEHSCTWIGEMYAPPTPLARPRLTLIEGGKDQNSEPDE